MSKKYPAEQFFSGMQLELAQAIRAEDIGEIDRLAKQVDLNRPGKEDMTLLFYAMQERKLKAVTRLVQLGANEEQEVPGIGQPISMAVRMKEPKVLKAILDGGGNPNAKSRQERGGTPILEEAVDHDNLESLKMLLDAGANVNARDSLGQTPIFRASNVSSFDAMKMLIDKGASLDVTNKRGITLAWVVHNEFEGQQNGLPDQKRKITAIRDLMIQRGIVFPPDPPQVVRQKLGIPE
jgi:ankyrin repeat protein